jgi:hypothetical protein
MPRVTKRCVRDLQSTIGIWTGATNEEAWLPFGSSEAKSAAEGDVDTIPFHGNGSTKSTPNYAAGFRSTLR